MIGKKIIQLPYTKWVADFLRETNFCYDLVAITRLTNTVTFQDAIMLYPTLKGEFAKQRLDAFIEAYKTVKEGDVILKSIQYVQDGIIKVGGEVNGIYWHINVELLMNNTDLNYYALKLAYHFFLQQRVGEDKIVLHH